jgi:hypothetical protein
MASVIGERGACLYVATLDDYVQAFKQSTLYFYFKQGGYYPNFSSVYILISYYQLVIGETM